MEIGSCCASCERKAFSLYVLGLDEERVFALSGIHVMLCLRLIVVVIWGM